MYVCIHVYMYICICVCISIYVYTQVSSSMYIHVSLSLYIYIYIYTSVKHFFFNCRVASLCGSPSSSGSTFVHSIVIQGVGLLYYIRLCHVIFSGCTDPVVHTSPLQAKALLRAEPVRWNVCISLSISLSLYIYIYIYIYAHSEHVYNVYCHCSTCDDNACSKLFLSREQNDFRSCCP